ncbi:MAG: Crp/Fnr family transcriptional regulator [Nitrospirae bacterium]|nr:MAG: Crp/Fnr family transcriptional regulator [Nitrospirota bacterium]
MLGGELKVSLLHEDGREAVLAELSRGDFFGEISFIDNKARSATVTALTDVQMLFLPGKHFIGVLRENADIGISILSVMGKRLRRSNEAIETLTFLDVTGRVSKLLLELASVHGEKNADGSIRIKGITHQKIALQVGASREAVTKTLQSLEEKGLISAKRGEIIILRR